VQQSGPLHRAAVSFPSRARFQSAKQSRGREHEAHEERADAGKQQDFI